MMRAASRWMLRRRLVVYVGMFCKLRRLFYLKKPVKMLSLQKSDDAVKIVGIYKGTRRHKRRKPQAAVYLTPTEDETHGNTAPAAGVLHLHRDAIKKELHINQPEFTEICALLDADEEPAADDPLKHAYWNVRERFWATRPRSGSS